jgi:hypothetical protein
VAAKSLLGQFEALKALDPDQTSYSLAEHQCSDLALPQKSFGYRHRICLRGQEIQ